MGSMVLLRSSIAHAEERNKRPLSSFVALLLWLGLSAISRPWTINISLISIRISIVHMRLYWDGHFQMSALRLLTRDIGDAEGHV